MRRVSKKTAKLLAAAKPIRKAMVAAAGQCEICGTSPQKRKYPISDLNVLCVHEIANGPDRLKCIDKHYGTLVLCFHCNGNVVTNKKIWPEARQLALLQHRRPEQYNLAAYNMMVNPRAPRRIEQHEVDHFSSFLD